MVAVLTAVILALTNAPVSLTCGGHPPDYPWRYPSALEGAARPGDYPKIWLESCRAAYSESRIGVTILAHEIIHIQHPWWPHPKVYYWDDWYGQHVVLPKLRKFKAGQ